MKKELLRIIGFSLFGFLFFLVSSCAITQTKYQQEYSRVWKELIKSKVWEEALLTKDEKHVSDDFYVSAENDGVILDEPSISINDTGFDDKYQSLVSRAYFKIITEAEKADARITAEYRLLNNQVASEKGIKEKSLQKQQHEIARKYNAHKAMLEGLKSWNIFSDDRSGDLDYFKAENKDAVQKMMKSNNSNSQMVNYLIYKLADLYHVEK